MADGMGMMMPPPPSPSSMPGMMPMDGGDGSHSMGMMHMTFFWGHRVDILFSGWPGDRGVGMYIVALLVVFVASVLTEFFAYVPHRLLAVDGKAYKGLILTVLVAIRTGLSYLVMLAVMSFNVGVLIVAIAGHALGFFLFGSGCVFKLSPPASDRVQADGHLQATVPPAKC